jgi:peptide/nickel transport system permease protein
VVIRRRADVAGPDPLAEVVPEDAVVDAPGPLAPHPTTEVSLEDAHAADDEFEDLGDFDVPGVGRTRRRKHHIFRKLAVFWISLLVGSALLAPLLPLRDPEIGGLPAAKAPYAGALLGTDQLGRDILSRVVYGGRTSLYVTALAVGLSLVFGVGIGLFAGYFRGKLDIVVTAVADIILAFPSLLLLIVISALAGPTVTNLIIGMAVLKFPTFVRLARANSMAFTQREFVLAAQGLGARDGRVAMREVLPNVLPAIGAYTFAAVGQVFVLEGAISFLGLGIQPPTPAWGSMISAGRPFLEFSPHIVLMPAGALFVTVLAFNALADARRQGDKRAQLGG